MKFRAITTFLSFVFIFFNVDGQKIKYKELFPILDAKNYAEGGPQLIAYLASLKKDEANPNLQMGLMLEDRFLNYDIISDSSNIYASGDSSVLYLEKAKTLITEKELKKNDEYYQAFFRRDLRTGEFGIKVSDVHLDIEKKIESIKTRIADVRSINNSLNRIQAKYVGVNKMYLSLAASYEDFNSLLLSISADDQSKIGEIQNASAEVVSEAKSIQEIAQRLGSEKYKDEVEIKTIETFAKDGKEITDVKNGSITLWDYETWSRETSSEIRGGVGLFKTMITNYTADIRSKKSRLKKSQEAEGLVVPGEIVASFEKYAPNSDVLTLLKVEAFEARVIKNVDLQLNRALMDSTKIGAQLDIYTQAKGNVDTLYTLINSTSIEGLAAAKKNFPDYINSFFSSWDGL